MDKRTFLRTSALASGGILAGAGLGFSSTAKALGTDFSLYPLPYSFDALEPYIDASTMEVHYQKHYAGYTTKFNEALAKIGLYGKPVEEIMRKAAHWGDAIRNQGGGYYNHTFFWQILTPAGDNKPSEKILAALTGRFGSLENFEEAFTKAALSVFGSGWAWLIDNNGSLDIVTTPNQDNPLMDIADKKGVPILGLDVWEHAYYLKYQNRRADYIKAFFRVVNWSRVESNLFNRA